jgi:hypothetical protein
MYGLRSCRQWNVKGNANWNMGDRLQGTGEGQESTQVPKWLWEQGR